MTAADIRLKIPHEKPYHGIARLVVGGLAARLDLSYEHLDDLQLSLMKALNKVLDGSHAFAEVVARTQLPVSEHERRKALLAYYIAVNETPDGATERLLSARLLPPGDNAVDLVHDLTDSLLGKPEALNGRKRVTRRGSRRTSPKETVA